MTETQKKIIFWSVIIALALGLFYWWGGKTKERIETFQTREFKESLNLPEIEIPKF